ncbi:type II secretion system protein [Endozoicomonas sp. G2_2]|nr:type II secretion system protein [Endozoicomonas sp. G2_2]
MIELLAAIALVSMLGIAIVTVLSGQRTQRNLQTTSEQMSAIARIAGDYRRMRSTAGDDYISTGSVDVATLNQRFDVSLALQNPWGGDYEIVTGPVNEIVRTVIPVRAEPPGFRVTALSGQRTRLEKQYIGGSGGPYTRRLRLIKKQLYSEDSR